MLWQVAWDGDQVVGQVLSLVQHGRAEVFEVSVRPAWRRRGLARALLSRALLTLRGRGIDVVRLGTVSEFRTRASGCSAVRAFPWHKSGRSRQGGHPARARIPIG